MPNGSGPITTSQVLPSASPSLIASLPRIAAATAGALPLGQPISLTFNIGGAPIAVLGGVFTNGLPIGGPLTQIFRGGSAPTPPTLFVSTLTSSGPIGAFLIGTSGAPIGELTFGGGALPIAFPPAEAEAVAATQPRTVEVGAAPAFPGVVTPPIVSFGEDLSGTGGPSGGGAGIGSGGDPIGG